MTTHAPLTADQIAAKLIANRYHRAFTLPCYTPVNWWECDVFEITKSGYFREYEIKISRADFKADAKKEVAEIRDYRGKVRREAASKHALLEDRSPRGPVQFWFVVPAGLVELHEVPRWAGLIEIRQGEGRWRGTIGEHERKKAPRLHKQKLSPEIEQHAKGVCYWRLMSEIVRRQRRTA